MKLVRPVLLALIIAGGFFYFTTSNSGRSQMTNWLGKPSSKVEITEAAASGNPSDADEQNNIDVYKRNIQSVVNITSRAVSYDFFYGLVPQEEQSSAQLS